MFDIGWPSSHHRHWDLNLSGLIPGPLLLTTKAVLLNWGRFETHTHTHTHTHAHTHCDRRDIWRHFWLSRLGGCHWHSMGRGEARAAACNCIMHRTAPWQRIVQPSNANSVEVKDPCNRSCCLPKLYLLLLISVVNSHLVAKARNGTIFLVGVSQKILLSL